MSKFLKAYVQTIVKPKSTFEALLSYEKHYVLGYAYILIPIIAYTLMYVFLTIGNGAPSVFAPWLNIPREDYYSVNRFLLAPSLILCWIVASALIQMISRFFNGTGTFEQTLTIIALSISISMWGGLIHDLPMSFLSAIGVIDAKQHEIDMNSPTIFRTLLWVCYSIYFTAFLILFPIAVKVVHKLKLSGSIIIGWLSFIIFQLIFLIFNR
jgi:hypothetical protein